MYDQLKSHLDNILSVGYDLGLYGLFLAIKALRNHLESVNPSMTTGNPVEKDFHEKIKNKLDALLENDYLKELLETRAIRYSDKVLQAEKCIRENQSGQTIVFVERVYTAKFLCQVLREILDNTVKIQYLTGSKTGLNDENFSLNHQVSSQQTLRLFSNQSRMDCSVKSPNYFVTMKFKF